MGRLKKEVIDHSISDSTNYGYEHGDFLFREGNPESLLADSTREGIHRTGRLILRKALEYELIKKDPPEFAYLKNDKKTIEQLEEEELPKYLEKEELAMFLNTAKEHGLEHDYLVFLILSYTGIRVVN
jgi:integrase